VPDPSVPENFLDIAGLPSLPVEPSFAEKNRLVGSVRRVVGNLKILAKKISSKSCCTETACELITHIGAPEYPASPSLISLCSPMVFCSSNTWNGYRTQSEGSAFALH
jgi:hypothetical protein